MSNPPEVNRPTESNPPLNGEINQKVPENSSSVVTVTPRDWNRLKEHLKSIKSGESLWLAAVTFFLSAGIAFLIGVFFLEQLDEVANWVLILFYCATAVGITGALVCLVAYVGSRSRRRNDVKIAIRHLEDIESASAGDRKDG